MEDFILKEIDKIGELVAGIASKMGIYKENIPDYTIADVQSEFAANKTGIDLDAIVKQQYPISYLVEQEKVTLKAL